MDTCWLVIIRGKEIDSINTFLYPCILISVSRKLIIWDTQTGVVVGELDTWLADRIIFHGDQRTITLCTWSLVFSTYDTLTGLQLSKDISTSSPYSRFGGYWTQRDTLQFATSSKATGGSVINIYKLQPTLVPPLYMLSSFHIPFTMKEFSFSPVSFHASFVTQDELIVLDVWTSQLLLQTKVAGVNPQKLPEFSPNGHFVACQTFDHEICIWQNGLNGYVPWCNLGAWFPFEGFSWSPTSALILGWGFGGIQLLCPNNHSFPLSNKASPNLQGKNYLVAYSADEAYIATTKEGYSVVTVLDCLWGTTPQLINTDMKIMDIKIVDNAVFVADRCRIVSWNLGAAGMVHSAYDGVTTISPTNNVNIHSLRLSPDCSLVAHEDYYHCQGITPSNSKGGLPAPEAGARTERGRHQR